VQWLPNAAVLSVTGVNGKYCDWLAGISLPLPTNTGNVEMHLVFALDANTLTNTQAIETDTKITDANKITYNGSLQFDYSQSPTLMFVQIDKAGGGWVNTGISLPKWTPNVTHTEDVYYSFNSTAKTYSVLQVVLDGVVYPTPASLHNLPGTNAGWAPSEILPQLQQDTNTKGGTWTWIVYEQTYSTW
jgi:hypothetical protein